jgi:hypothetical protein
VHRDRVGHSLFAPNVSEELHDLVSDVFIGEQLYASRLVSCDGNAQDVGVWRWISCDA